MEGYALMDVARDTATVDEILQKSRVGFIPNTKTGTIERRIYTLGEYLKMAEAYEKDER